MTHEEKQMILNRKIDTDISASLFLMRIIRKYLSEHKEESGVIGSTATNQESQSTPPTPTSSSAYSTNTPTHRRPV
jgi:hypothetical protein